MNFNNSCFFTALANLLLDYDIDVEDRDIIGNSLVPYMFDFDEGNGTYKAGYQFQDSWIVNQYLGKYSLRFVEETFTDYRGFLIYLQTSGRCVTPLNVLNGNQGTHAVIFEGYKDEAYKFLNMRRRNTDEPSSYILSEEELIDMLPSNLRCGKIVRGTLYVDDNCKSVLDESLKVLSQYKADLIRSLHTPKSTEERMIERDILYKPLLLNYRDIAIMLDNKYLVNIIETLLDEYVRTFKIKGAINLSDHLDLKMVQEVFDNIRMIIENKLSTMNL